MEKPESGSKGSARCSRRAFPRAVRIVAGLLVVQAAGLAGVGFLFWAIEYVGPGLPAGLANVIKQLSGLSHGGLSWAVLFALVGVLALIAALGLFRLRQAAWVLAMGVQGIQLLVALVLYFTLKPQYVYLIMVCSVFMVLYLNYSEVADAFRPDQSRFQGRQMR